MSGRPKGTSLDASSPSVEATDAVEIDERGRFSIPSWIAESVPWISSARAADVRCFSLMKLENQGVIRFLSWEEHSGLILARRRELVDRNDRHGVRLLEQRYQRLLIPKDLRPVVGDAGRAHLELAPTSTQFVYLVYENLEISLINGRVLASQLAIADIEGVFENLP